MTAGRWELREGEQGAPACVTALTEDEGEREESDHQIG